MRMSGDIQAFSRGGVWALVRAVPPAPDVTSALASLGRGEH